MSMSKLDFNTEEEKDNIDSWHNTPLWISVVLFYVVLFYGSTDSRDEILSHGRIARSERGQSHRDSGSGGSRPGPYTSSRPWHSPAPSDLRPGPDLPAQMASTGRSMLLSLLLFAVTLSLLEMYRGKFASSELMTIAGGFVSSLLFLLLLTFIGNYQEASGVRTGWGAVVVAELVALVIAGTIHRVCITTCFLFSAGFLYEVDKLSGMILARSESKVRRH
ncbi:hypothetical protein GUJ93_ZPchr0005g16219 [Zizania palustris]|uniref:Dolichyl-diphosphooligosaccharide--protein glycosyltransferase subunit KCP2 n=1 Tax=Zizania palustris TaxID=103762 RepID=A0A8J5T4M8_ZIZPA|nr:hypothetical protein GUJ93_ZPchr0005g16219 [Zizania palustris]